MRKVRVKLLKKSLKGLIEHPTNQQFRAYKRNYKKGLV